MLSAIYGLAGPVFWLIVVAIACGVVWLVKAIR